MAAIRLALVLWEVMLVMFSTYFQTKQSSGFRSEEEGDQTDLISLRLFVFSVKIWLVWHLSGLHFKPSFTHAFKVVCETPKSLTICWIGRWGVSSKIDWTFSMNSLVRVFLVVSFCSTTSKGLPISWAMPSSVEPSGFAFWGCWQWSCCHNFDR